jgi:hypothetical protein
VRDHHRRRWSGHRSDRQQSGDSIARQPKAGGRIFISMIIAAALIEGVTFFALLICFLAIFWLRGA